MSVRCFVGAVAVDSVPADDRGFAYGDGVFETMRAHAGAVPWWDAHWARLIRGAARLRMTLPDQDRVLAEAESLLGGAGGVLKLVVSRGCGGRGYAPPAAATPTWVLSRHALPSPFPERLTLRWCDTRLGLQPALAGIKHCNRLEQVLARAEWDGAPEPERTADEGLMRSSDGEVVCATAANLFVLRGGRWRTPRIDRCGVAGICRQWLLGAVDVEETVLQVADIETADAIFLCNAVRGILPVVRLGARNWPLHGQVIELQRRLAVVHPGFGAAPATETS